MATTFGLRQVSVLKTGRLARRALVLGIVTLVAACGGGDTPPAPPGIESGRFVAFESGASNLVPGDTNGFLDVFVHDTRTGVTTRVSVGLAGVQGNMHSFRPAISADGRFVAFHSDATNLVPGDTNERGDVFVHDTRTGVTTRVSVNSAGVQGNVESINPAIREYGRFVGLSDGEQILIAGINPAISADGRFVAFESDASNLVPVDTNGVRDVFVHDTLTGVTTRVPVDSAGVQGNESSFDSAISADGRFVTFVSDASNLVSGDTNGRRDVFVRDTLTGVTTRVSVDSARVEGNEGSWFPAISVDGRFVAFNSDASNLVTGDTNGHLDVFVHDTRTGVTTRVSVDSAGVQGNEGSFRPAISADRRFVAFVSWASNLVPEDTDGFWDVFVRDTFTGMTTRVSVNSAGVQGNGFSYGTAISADGRFVAFESGASNLVTGDTNATADVFVRDTLTGVTTRVSVDSAGVQGNADSGAAAIR